MKYLFSLAALLACAGCARSITYTSYPGVANSAAIPRDAHKECAKYGMKPILFRGNGFTDFGRTTQTWECVPQDQAIEIANTSEDSSVPLDIH